jgi:hypothetical protein
MQVVDSVPYIYAVQACYGRCAVDLVGLMLAAMEMLNESSFLAADSAQFCCERCCKDLAGAKSMVLERLVAASVSAV